MDIIDNDVSDFAGRSELDVKENVANDTFAVELDTKPMNRRRERGSLYFGGDDHVRLTSLSNLAANDASVELWLMVSSFQNTEAFVLSDRGADGSELGISYSVVSFDTLSVSFHIVGASTQCVTTGISNHSLGSWQHFAGVRVGDELRIYIDGALQGSSSSCFAIVNNAGGPAPILGARSENSMFMEGFLDDLRVWNKARSASEIHHGMATEYSRLQAGLVSHWPFDEQGSTVYDRLNPEHGDLHGDLDEIQEVMTSVVAVSEIQIVTTSVNQLNERQAITTSAAHVDDVQRIATNADQILEKQSITAFADAGSLAAPSRFRSMGRNRLILHLIRTRSC